MEVFWICDLKSSPVFPFSHQLEQPKIYKGGICVCVSSVWSFRTFSIYIHLMSLDQCDSLKQRFSENFGKEDHWLIMSKWLDSSGEWKLCPSVSTGSSFSSLEGDEVGPPFTLISFQIGPICAAKDTEMYINYNMHM